MQMLAVPFAAARFAEQGALKELNVTVQMAQQCDAKSVLSSIHGGRNLSPESIMVKAVAVTQRLLRRHQVGPAVPCSACRRSRL